MYFGFPGRKLKVYGITGTDGKTTSSTLLYHVLKTAGFKVALISTVAAFIGDEEIDTGFHVTSPEPWQIQKLLKRCLDEGIEHVVLEVTSHGIYQFRVWGIDFQLAGVTNITPEHLDYFENYDTYLQAKAELLLSAQTSFLNEDDQSFAPLKKIFAAEKKSFQTYSQSLSSTKVDQAIKQRFPEQYNRWNAKLVYALAKKLKVEDQTFADAVKTFTGIRGRMEEIENTLGIKIIVDFAHTPNALEKALLALRPETKGKLWAIFGCAGLRDRSKRAPMGRISTELADMAIFTSEDPRTEDVNVIIRQMKEGIQSPNHRKVMSQPDRRKAIEYALKNAKRGDTIGIFGKGHERSLAFGKTEHPWSDQDAVRDILQSL